MEATKEFVSWCVAANNLRIGGQINNDPRKRVLSITPASEHDSIVVIEFEGRKLAATVRNLGVGQNAFFRPA